MTKKEIDAIPYENNPFFVATNGITLLMDKARAVGILLVVLSVLGFAQSFFSPSDTNNATMKERLKEIQDTVSGWSTSEWFIVVSSAAVIALALIMVTALLKGVAAYTSAQIAKGRTVELGEAFRVSFENLWSFLWLQVIIALKLFLWTLLFIVPGIIMTIRYSLASVAFFDDSKDVRGNAAIKESLRLTKGGFMTTLGSNWLFNIITLGLLGDFISTAVNAILYRQFDALGDEPKPAAHWLSWITLALPFVLVGLFIFLLIILIVVLAATGTRFS